MLAGLTVACWIEEDMNNFGGVIVVSDGVVHDVVRDCLEPYDVRKHRRDARTALKTYFALIQRDRPWCITPSKAWENGYMKFDALFDDEFVFYFRTREEMAAFRARYAAKHAMRLVGREWRRTSLVTDRRRRVVARL